MRPVIVYVDDQKENLVIFKGACPAEWDVYLFDSPVEAIKDLEVIKPWVVLSDQKMPIMAGFQFLEVCRGMRPNCVRIIVTGYNDEELLISSIRKAHITDFFKKPWSEDELVTRISSAIGHYRAQEESKRFENELISNRKELKIAKIGLANALREVVLVKEREDLARKNLESWVPPFIVDSLEHGISLDNIKRNVASITFDIKGSARLIEISHEGFPIRNKIIKLFTESVHRHGGIRESISGDSSLGHFGLIRDSQRPAGSALSAAFDFRMALNNLTNLVNLEPNSISVGIALHFTTELPIHIHSTHFHGDGGELLEQKSFDTSSFSTDLVHRIEKITHPLIGTNIIMTKQFVQNLKSIPPGMLPIGLRIFNGHKEAVELFVLPSDEAAKTGLGALNQVESDKKTG